MLARALFVSVQRRGGKKEGDLKRNRERAGRVETSEKHTKGRES